MKCEEPEKFCDENFLNFRALRQADNIKNQLYEILESCNMNCLERAYQEDPNYLYHLEMRDHFEELPEKYRETLLRRVLAIAFYFSTARLSKNAAAYLLNYP